MLNHYNFQTHIRFEDVRNPHFEKLWFHWFIYNIFYKLVKRKRIFKIIFIFPESCGIVSKTLLNIATLLRIHYKITVTEKLLRNNTKTLNFLLLLGKRVVIKTGTGKLKRKIWKVHFSKSPEKLFSIILMNDCLWEYSDLSFCKTFSSL